MNILVINCGSSTLKFQLLHAGKSKAGPDIFTRLASGMVDRIGDKGTIEFRIEQGTIMHEAVAMMDHGEAIRRVLTWVESHKQLKQEKLTAIGHRIVHGGQYFTKPILINESVVEKLENISSLAPLHNGPALKAIHSALIILGDQVPMVAVFDTDFHSGIPEYAYRYAIPYTLTGKYNIRKYGFHGMAHRYMTERYAAITSTPAERTNLITLQLGNGCSAAAVKSGVSIETSMGFTPLEGLMMGTRCGDIDPSLAGFLARNENSKIEEVEQWLNTQSGLMGVSGLSGDMRELLVAEKQGNKRAQLAVDMFCYRVRKYIGAYLAVLGGADAIIFGGGIGENSPEIRYRICSDMEWCGIILDRDINLKSAGIEARITEERSPVHCYVIQVDEAIVIAQDTLNCVKHLLKK